MLTMGTNETSVVTESDLEPSIDNQDAILVTLRGHSLGRRISLSPDHETLKVGRDDEAEICLHDDCLSRFHCRLFFMDSSWFIEDLESTNGTYVGGQAIDRAPLRDGDLIKVGATIFKFLYTQNIEAAFHEEIYRLAIIDGLTQIYNRRYLMEFIEREISRCRRHGRPMSLIMFDLDGFKQINDQFGHLSGDHILRSVASKLNRRIRREELFARFGGDEFVIVLPETVVEDAMKFAEIIRENIEMMSLTFDGWKIPLTVSLGVGRYHQAMNTAEDLIAAADTALYRAKANGRNQASE